MCATSVNAPSPFMLSASGPKRRSPQTADTTHLFAASHTGRPIPAFIRAPSAGSAPRRGVRVGLRRRGLTGSDHGAAVRAALEPVGVLDAAQYTVGDRSGARRDDPAGAKRRAELSRVCSAHRRRCRRGRRYARRRPILGRGVRARSQRASAVGATAGAPGVPVEPSGGYSQARRMPCQSAAPCVPRRSLAGSP